MRSFLFTTHISPRHIHWHTHFQGEILVPWLWSYVSMAFRADFDLPKMAAWHMHRSLRCLCMISLSMASIVSSSKHTSAGLSTQQTWPPDLGISQGKGRERKGKGERWRERKGKQWKIKTIQDREEEGKIVVLFSPSTSMNHHQILNEPYLHIISVIVGNDPELHLMHLIYLFIHLFAWGSNVEFHGQHD